MAFPLVAIPIIGDLLKAGIDIINKFVPDKDLAAKLQQELLMESLRIDREHLAAAKEEAAAQADINKIEAASDKLFVSGWRPAIGWVCALGFLYEVIGRQALLWYLALNEITLKSAPPTLSGVLWEVTFGMLGLGAFRTFEKLRGVNAKKVGK